MNLVALSLALLMAAPAPWEKSMEAFIAELPPLDLASSQSGAGQSGGCYQSDDWNNGKLVADQSGVGTGWLLFGLVPIIGLVGAAVAPGSDPPLILIENLPESERRCFGMGYRDQSKSRKQKHALIGSLGGVLISLALISAANEN